MSREEYMHRHQNEKGFSVQEVELSLKKFLMVQASNRLSWDDVIDMFIIRKSLAPTQTFGPTS